MNSNPTGQTQLSVRLDVIEAREKRKQEMNPPGRVCACIDCVSSREKVALVKALRRALEQLWEVSQATRYGPGGGDISDCHKYDSGEAISDITAILTNSSTAPSVPEEPERKELGEPGASIGPRSVQGQMGSYDELVSEVATLRAKLNAPELLSFRDGVVLEAAHQRDRWASGHDAGKESQDWFWLIGYLAGKALRSSLELQAQGNSDALDKALHHTISTAAVLANWHAALLGANKVMRPGISAEKQGAVSSDPSGSDNQSAAQCSSKSSSGGRA